MTGFSLYYIAANLVCTIVFGIILFHNHNNIDRQEKQIKFDHALIAFIVYFLTDSACAGIVDGLLPRSMFSIVTFLIYFSMVAVIYFWLEYVMAYEQVPHRNHPLRRLVLLLPFLISTIAFVVNYIIAPQTLISSTMETQPLFTLYLSLVPDLYMVLILFYTIRRAHREENPAEK